MQGGLSDSGTMEKNRQWGPHTTPTLPSALPPLILTYHTDYCDDNLDLINHYEFPLRRKLEFLTM